MKSMLFRLKFVLMISFMLFLSACAGGSTTARDEVQGGNGILKMTIMSPYGTIISEDEQSYYDGESKSVSKSVVGSRYKDYSLEYSSSAQGAPMEPYCRIGGLYTMEVENVVDTHTSGEVTTGGTYDLYYCRTTKDLINQIKIPADWVNSELSLYCNDGLDINFKDLNLDFLTTKFNKYKICILKNEDLFVKNTIIYGYEVGNKIIDSKLMNLFNPNGEKFMLANEGLSVNTTERGLIENRLDYISIPYESSCHSCQNIGGSYGGYFEGANNNCVVQQVPETGSACTTVETKDFTVDAETEYYSVTHERTGGGNDNDEGGGTYTTEESRIVYHNIWDRNVQTVTGYRCAYKPCNPTIGTKITGAFPNADISSKTFVSDRAFIDSQNNYVNVQIDGVSQVGNTIYKFNNQFSYNVTDYQVNSAELGTFYFAYDDSSTFFSLRDTTENLDTLLTSVFKIPNEFGLSRTAMFRSTKEGKKVYGYETIAKNKLGENNVGANDKTKAIYTIFFDNSFSFSANDCFVSLASYDAGESAYLSSGTGIACGTGVITLNSINLDSQFSKGIALTLFKNIILNLE